MDDNYIIWIIAGTSTVCALFIFNYYTYRKGCNCNNEEDRRQTINL